MGGRERRHRGTVISYSTEAGYGFLLLDDGRKVFAHGRDLGGMVLTEGDRIECILDLAGQGLQALCVQRVFSSTMT